MVLTRKDRARMLRGKGVLKEEVQGDVSDAITLSLADVAETYFMSFLASEDFQLTTASIISSAGLGDIVILRVLSHETSVHTLSFSTDFTVAGVVESPGVAGQELQLTLACRVTGHWTEVARTAWMVT